ncbi:TonB family protein [Sphingomonas japonica]|uniref:TonB family protein n=1 Tax=Sphingomonas japonica TaxID=511662 RepID=A0ABX0U552_9SPHN|nr:TonB family protein [Sphingomonas japonica]NIJ24949.1 TonB family protein [Sphingomonas japonica]
MSMLMLMVQVGATPPPPGPPPPPVVVEQFAAARDPQPLIVTYRGSQARCGGTPVSPVHVEPPVPFAHFGGQSGIAPLALRFRIDARGRPVSIDGVDGRNYQTADVIPSFVAWRFQPDEQRSECAITLYPVSQPIADTDQATLVRYFAAGGGYGSPMTAQLVRRIVPAGSDCIRGWPQLLTQVTPRFADLPGDPGTITTTAVAFDIDADGRPTDVRTFSGRDNVALDRAAAKAVAQWRYADGPRRGCAYPLWRSSSDTLGAPDAPRGGGAECGLPDEWATPPRLEFPAAYKRRRIEGWALIGFDVAPWGALGNLRVLHAEPTFEFGEAALGVARSATKPKSNQGASNCSVMVQFKLDRGY